MAEMVSFEDIVGQKQALDVLEKAFKTKRLPHAYMFVGPEGVGKETTAKALFLKLVCHKQKGCNQCIGCRKYIKGIHPDVEILSPQGKNIKIGQIRDLERKLRFIPLEAPKRLILIPQAEYLSREAANALLKSLEEPPPYTLFILIARSTDYLLPTIVSRTQVIRFRPLSQEALKDLLINRFGKIPEEAFGLSVLAEGSIGRALRISEKGYLEELSRLAHALQQPDPTFLLGLAETLANLREQLPTFLELLLVWLRQSLRAQWGLEDYPNIFPPPVPKSIIVTASHLVEESLQRLEFNVQRELNLLSLFLQLRELWNLAEKTEVSTKGASST